ncbi:serine hydrolase domain-containing protein [Paenibacillus sp. GCM10027626]|uniref:serine hydrolase domain-containing protein n=1 Tax=Paenibacillus sp. GCM10027626 TaxID=3273411 RepID=UPI00363EB416
MDIEWLERAASEFKQWQIKDIVAIQDGETKWEWHEGDGDRVSAIYSCTKSIISSLVGIAISRGELADVQQPLAEFFPQLEKDQDRRKLKIRLKHLLTMTPGFDWPDFDKPYWAMKRTDDAVKFILGRAMAHEPGEVFTYNSGASYLLSAILTQATGLSVYDYAEQHLFSKLSFRKPRWNRLHGIYEGGAGLHLASKDMAKFGQLYLQGGRWQGKQLVPSSWVEDSTRERHKGLMHYEPPIFGAYGYHWWMSGQGSKAEYYFAKGYGGQYIFVVPALRLAAAIRKEATGKADAIYSKRVLLDYLIPASSHKNAGDCQKDR